MSDREVYLDDHGRSHGEPSDLVIAKLGARARKYRRALEEIKKENDKFGERSIYASELIWHRTIDKIIAKALEEE